MHDALKTVVVTGGTRGIGAAIAQNFYQHGYRVVLCGRVDNGFAHRLGPNASFVRADVSKPAQMRSVMRKAAQSTGQIDVLINSAGFSQWKELKDVDSLFLGRMLDTNLKGVFWSIQSALPYFLKQAAIINVASLAGKRGSANNSAYCASKFGVIGLTQSLAKELGPRGIRVNAVCPVYVLTDAVIKALGEKSSPAKGKDINAYLKDFTMGQTALLRLPTADEVSNLCLFLASSQASAVTGQCINVDCGTLPQ